jgi:hypothetical protein
VCGEEERSSVFTIITSLLFHKISVVDRSRHCERADFVAGIARKEKLHACERECVNRDAREVARLRIDGKRVIVLPLQRQRESQHIHMQCVDRRVDSDDSADHRSLTTHSGEECACVLCQTIWWLCQHTYTHSEHTHAHTRARAPHTTLLTYHRWQRRRQSRVQSIESRHQCFDHVTMFIDCHAYNRTHSARSHAHTMPMHNARTKHNKSRTFRSDPTRRTVP